jgi:hypothetical protein
LIGVYVGNCLVIGKNSLINKLIDELKKHFSLKMERNVKDYLSCNIIELKEENKFVIVQAHLITSPEEKFTKETMNKHNYGTPDNEYQKKYQSGVGMLLYLTKYSQPDISNVVRKLSICMDRANWDGYLKMLRVSL